jgi:hypothetical protein
MKLSYSILLLASLSYASTASDQLAFDTSASSQQTMDSSHPHKKSVKQKLNSWVMHSSFKSAKTTKDEIKASGHELKPFHNNPSSVSPTIVHSKSFSLKSNANKTPHALTSANADGSTSGPKKAHSHDNALFVVMPIAFLSLLAGCAFKVLLGKLPSSIRPPFTIVYLFLL